MKVILYNNKGNANMRVMVQVFINSDFAVSTTPYFQTEKSGVYVACRKYNLSSVSFARKWTSTKRSYEITQIIQYKRNNLNLVPMNFKEFDLQSMTAQFINSLSIT